LLPEQARSWWIGDETERKENERGFPEDTTLIPSWTELEHHTKKIQESRHYPK
jgi:hypothetical protein